VITFGSGKNSRRIAFTVAISLFLGAAAAIGGEKEAPDARRQVNLLSNPGFEFAGKHDEVAADWLPFGENQISSWQGVRYGGPHYADFVPSQRDEGSSRTGLYGLRLISSGLAMSGAWQKVTLLQTKPKPILLSVWSRLDGSAGWAEFGIANVRYMDGTKGEIDRSKPLIDLRKGDGKWIRQQALYKPAKPVRYIEVKIDLQQGSSPAFLRIDDAIVAEVDSTVSELRTRGLKVPGADLTVAPSWASFERNAFEMQLIANGGNGAPIDERLLLLVIAESDALVIETQWPLKKDESLEFLLAPYDRKPFSPNYAADLFRVSFSKDGKTVFSWGMTRNERHLGITEDAAYFLEHEAIPPIRTSKIGSRISIRVPYETIEQEVPQSSTWRLNACLRQGERLACSAPTYSRERLFGRLIFPDQGDQASPLSINRVNLRNTDWNAREVELGLSLETQESLNVLLTAKTQSGQKSVFPLTIEPGQGDYSRELSLPETGLQFIDLNIAPDNKNNEPELASVRIPTTVSSPLWAWMYEVFAYEDENEVEVRAQISGRTAEKTEWLQVYIEDWRGRQVGKPVRKKPKAKTLFFMPIGDIPANDEPVCDHKMVVRALDKNGELLVESRLPFGRIRRPEQRKAEPIESVRVNEKGYLEVNGKPFFAVISSLQTKDHVGGYLRTPRVGYNAVKINVGAKDQIAASQDNSSAKDIYARLYGQGVYAAPMVYEPRNDEGMRELFDWFKKSPSFLLVVGGELYYEDGSRYDKAIWREYPERPLLLEHQNCGSWLSMSKLGEPIGDIAMTWVGSHHISPSRSMAAFFARERAVDPGVGLLPSVGIILAPSYSIWDSRMLCYLGIVEGATGAYLVTVARDEEGHRLVEQARGLATELRTMGPIFTSENQRRTIRVLPATAGLQVAERRVDKKHYVFVVNPTFRPVKARFMLSNREAVDSMDLRFERKDLFLDDSGCLEDELPPRWARVYQIQLK